MTLYIKEIKNNLKNLLIWSVCVGGMCMACILLYTSMQDSMQGMNESFSNMGAFSTAFGMNKLGVESLAGYYASAVAAVHSLGGAMFVALLSTQIVSKEEAGHTAEFLNVLPISRKSIIVQKYLALITLTVIFHIICVMLYVISFAIVNEDIGMREFFMFHGAQVLMNIEIATICFAVSAYNKRNMIGAGMGIAIGFYAIDLIVRIVPKIENLKYLTPFYYANAADVFVSGSISWKLLVVSVIVIIAAFIIALVRYERKDIAA